MDVDRPRPLLLDGATATNLYGRGMPRGVCPEEWALAHPAALAELQREFVAAGSEVLYAPTFGANRARLARYGHGAEVRDYNLRLVALSRQAAAGAARPVRVAGNLSPSGVAVEPYGEWSFDALVELFAEQARALCEAGVDLFVIETMLSLPEARAAVLACRDFDKPVWVSFAVKEGGELRGGGAASSALVALQGMGIAAFGVNCASPAVTLETIRELAHFSAVPLLAKPGAGEPNPALPGRYDLSPQAFAEMGERLLRAGASILGGCCGARPTHIAALRELCDRYVPAPRPESHDEVHDILLATERELFMLDNERIEFTEPVVCERDMADVLLAVGEDCDVVQVNVETPEEAWEFAQNAHFAKLPVCFHSNSEAALERALYLYPGRCMVDRDTAIPERVLVRMAARYGAVVY